MYVPYPVKQQKKSATLARLPSGALLEIRWRYRDTDGVLVVGQSGCSKFSWLFLLCYRVSSSGLESLITTSVIWFLVLNSLRAHVLLQTAEPSHLAAECTNIKLAIQESYLEFKSAHGRLPHLHELSHVQPLFDRHRVLKASLAMHAVMQAQRNTSIAPGALVFSANFSF